jgi:hypothetical protein
VPAVTPSVDTSTVGVDAGGSVVVVVGGTVTLVIKGHRDDGPVVDAMVANFHILSPTD